MKKCKAWLLRDKSYKMRRSIWFLKCHAKAAQHDYEEVVEVELYWKVVTPIQGK